MTAEDPDRRGPGRRRAARRPLRRWLAAGGVAVLGAVVGTALVLQAAAAPSCAAPPTGDTVHRGKATFYDLQALANCSLAAPDDGLFVALGPSEYADAAACGGYLDVTGPKGSVRVKVIDRCPECAPGHLDLSRTAFTRIADPVQGIVPITYRAVVNPRPPGPLSFRIKEGASEFWFAVLVDNHANPLRSVEVRTAGGDWRRPVRHDFNYWIADGGLGAGPFRIRVTDVYGRRATADGITMTPGTVQLTDVRVAGAVAAPTRTPSARPSPKPARRSPSPSPSAARAAPPPSPALPAGTAAAVAPAATTTPDACA